MKKTDVKLLAIVTGGVLLAGVVMSQFRDVGAIATARAGYK